MVRNDMLYMMPEHDRKVAVRFGLVSLSDNDVDKLFHVLECARALTICDIDQPLYSIFD